MVYSSLAAILFRSWDVTMVDAQSSVWDGALYGTTYVGFPSYSAVPRHSGLASATRVLGAGIDWRTGTDVLVSSTAVLKSL